MRCWSRSPKIAGQAGTEPRRRAIPSRAPASARPPSDPIEREVFERVIAEVEKRITTELERRVARQLVPQIHAAVRSAVRELHNDIAKAINEALKARQVK